MRTLGTVLKSSINFTHSAALCELKIKIFQWTEWRGVLRDEFLWSHFFTSEKYDIRAFQNHAECPHTTSSNFFSISWKMHKTTRIFGLFFCVTRKYRYRGDTQDVVWRRSIRFWEAQRLYFSSLKPLKWPSDPRVTFGQHLLPKIWPKNGLKSPFSTFLKGRGVLRDEFLSWPKFQNFENII